MTPQEAINHAAFFKNSEINRSDYFPMRQGEKGNPNVERFYKIGDLIFFYDQKMNCYYPW